MGDNGSGAFFGAIVCGGIILFAVFMAAGTIKDSMPSCPDCNCFCEIQTEQEELVFGANPKIQRMVDCTSACTQAIIYSDAENKVEAQEKCFQWCEQEIGYRISYA